MSRAESNTYGQLENTNYLWGAFNPINAHAENKHLGIFNMQYTPFSFGVPFLDDVWGPSATFSTAAATIGSLGGATLYKHVTNRKRSPVMNCVFKLNDISDVLLYIGFFDGSWESDPTGATGTDPLNGRSGIALIIRSGNFEVAHNDGTGATVFDPLPSGAGPLTTPVDTIFHTFQITADDPNGRFIVELNKYSAFGVVSRLVVNTEIPSSTTPLTPMVRIETEVAATKSFVLHRWELWC